MQILGLQSSFLVITKKNQTPGVLVHDASSLQSFNFLSH